jgi:hypothetical protein
MQPCTQQRGFMYVDSKSLGYYQQILSYDSTWYIILGSILLKIYKSPSHHTTHAFAIDHCGDVHNSCLPMQPCTQQRGFMYVDSKSLGYYQQILSYDSTWYIILGPILLKIYKSPSHHTTHAFVIDHCGWCNNSWAIVAKDRHLDHDNECCKKSSSNHLLLQRGSRHRDLRPSALGIGAATNAWMRSSLLVKCKLVLKLLAWVKSPYLHGHVFTWTCTKDTPNNGGAWVEVDSGRWGLVEIRSITNFYLRIPLHQQTPSHPQTLLMPPSFPSDFG